MKLFEKINLNNFYFYRCDMLFFFFFNADLVFTFVDELLPDQTPETVHLMPAGEIIFY